MTINDREEIATNDWIPVDALLQKINEAKKRFEERGCTEIKVSIDGDNYGSGFLEMHGKRIATKEEEIKYNEPPRKVKLTYVQRNIG